jgi:hypothetical protein
MKQKAVKILNVKKKEMLGRKLSSLSPREKNELKHATDDFIRKSKPINPKIYQENNDGVVVTNIQCHKGWITKLHYSSEL